MQPDPPVGLNWTLLNVSLTGTYYDTMLSWKPPQSADVEMGWMTLQYEVQYRDVSSDLWEVVGVRTTSSKLQFYDHIKTYCTDWESNIPWWICIVFVCFSCEKRILNVSKRRRLWCCSTAPGIWILFSSPQVDLVKSTHRSLYALQTNVNHEVRVRCKMLGGKMFGEFSDSVFVHIPSKGKHSLAMSTGCTDKGAILKVFQLYIQPLEAAAECPCRCEECFCFHLLSLNISSLNHCMKNSQTKMTVIHDVLYIVAHSFNYFRQKRSCTTFCCFSVGFIANKTRLRVCEAVLRHTLTSVQLRLIGTSFILQVFGHKSFILRGTSMCDFYIRVTTTILLL